MLDDFLAEYVPLLRNSPCTHVVMLIDFDEHEPDRRQKFQEAIPSDVVDRVFVIGTKTKPETLKRQQNRRSLELIGSQLADECHTGQYQLWQQEQLVHNQRELARLRAIVKPFLFK